VSIVAKRDFPNNKMCGLVESVPSLVSKKREKSNWSIATATATATACPL
jgi:hypothetical protein